MAWFLIAVLSYFFNALAQILDKYLLSGRIKEPAVYAFFASVFSLFALGFIPFGFQFLGWRPVGLSFLSGVLFLYGLLFFYQAVKHSEVSRVAPVVGTIMSVVAIFVNFIPSAGRPELTITPVSFVALLLLVGGGLLLAFSDPFENAGEIPTSALLAGLLMASSLLILKASFIEENFVSSFVVSRLGMFGAGLSLLLLPRYRFVILGDCFRMSTPSRQNVKTGLLFVVNKVSGGLSSILLSFAAFLGPVTLVQAFSGVQYFFVLVFAWALSVPYQGVFEERFTRADWIQKVIGIVLVGVGMWLAATAGANILY